MNVTFEETKGWLLFYTFLSGATLPFLFVKSFEKPNFAYASILAGMFLFFCVNSYFTFFKKKERIVLCDKAFHFNCYSLEWLTIEPLSFRAIPGPCDIYSIFNSPMDFSLLPPFYSIAFNLIENYEEGLIPIQLSKKVRVNRIQGFIADIVISGNFSSQIPELVDTLNNYTLELRK